MADQTITVKQFTMPTQFLELAAGDYEDLTAANDGIFVVPKDGKFLIHAIDAAGGAVLTITGDDTTSGYTTQAPLGPQGEIESSAAAALGGTGAVMTINLNNFAVLESARFKWLQEDDGVIAANTGMKGKIRIQTTANVKVAVIALN